MSIEALKEQARRHEQREEWRKALEEYKQAIGLLEEAGQPDIGLYNRVGDIYVRLTLLEEAVTNYEKAVDLYVEEGLENNAIAVCKKIIRNVPHRDQVYLRMGQIRAQQGFISDARTSFLVYAERMQQGGDLDESFRALVEFCDVAPGEVELRMAVADQMITHQRFPEAVDQLGVAYRALMESGEADGAATVAAKVREIDPEIDLTVAPTVAEELEEAVLPGSSVGTEVAFEEAAFEEALLAESTAGTMEGFETTALGSDNLLGEGVDTVVAEDEGVPAAEVYAEVPELPSVGGSTEEPHSTEDEAPAEEDVFDLPLLEVPAEDDAPAEEDVFDLPLLEVPAEDEAPAEEDVFDLPLLEVPAEDEPSSIAAEGSREQSWEDATEEDAFDLPLLDTAEEDQPLSTLAGESREEVWEDAAADDEAPADEEVRGADPAVEPEDGGVAQVRATIEADPDNVDLRQRMVELAYRSGETSVLVEAFMGLGDVLGRAGDDARAKVAYQQVIRLDEGHVEARAALGEASPERQAPVKEVAAHEDYVDLGSLILGDEVEKSTRFTVTYEEPSGDEEADFAKMLSQFKEKVSQNLDVDDTRAHHDLGTAYKEMGLLDEAVAEFQQALRGAGSHLPTYEVLGQTFLEMDNPAAAVRTLERALEVDFAVEDELLGIYYYLGQAYQSVGRNDRAVEFYDRVFSLDINFADVTERLRALR
jgi:tetratricopeptide (TPR) repeat protein